MGAQPLRVFVSHTSELAAFPEKRSYVEAACAAVRRAGGVAVDMADFGARDQRSPEVCRAEVAGCDVYLGVVGFRYGSPVPGRDDGLSYTEFEFEVAGRAGLPRLVFLLDEAAATVPPALAGPRPHPGGPLPPAAAAPALRRAPPAPASPPVRTA